MPPESIMSGSSGGSAPMTPNAMDAMYQVKLLQALRNGDPALIHPFLTEINKDKRKSQSTAGDIDTAAAALHLAIRCASIPTITLLLANRAISPNGVHPPGSGTTPLHLAASLGRVDVVKLLLEQEGVDDSKRDAEGRGVVDVAKGKEVAKVIADSHAFLNASYRSLLRSYILSPSGSTSSSSPSSNPPPALLTLLASPRTRYIDLSYLDDTSGSSLLHEAARRRDLRLIELAVRAGADVFVRDRRGRLPAEGSKDERVRVFLRQFANHDTTLLGDEETHVKDAEPPSMKGYLNKYTNVAKGYNTRWFVLKGGVLSYYRHQNDETIASRGSISLKSATLKLPLPTSSSTSSRLQPSANRNNAAPSMSPSPSTSTTSDRLRIEVHAHGGQKWYMKANHPVEAARWAAALRRSAVWARREDVEGAGAEHGSGGERRNSAESGESFARSVRSKAGTLLRRGYHHGAGGSTKGDAWVGAGTPTGTTVGGDVCPEMGLHSARPPPDGREHEGDDEDDLDDHEDADGDEGSMTGSGSGGEGEAGHPPHEGVYELQGNALLAQIELTAQLVASLTPGAGISGTSTPSSFAHPNTPARSSPTASFASSSPTPSSHSQAHAALTTALQTAHSLVTSHLAMSQARDTYWRQQAVRARRRQAVWAESLATVVREGEGLEKELRSRSRRRGSRFFDSSEGGSSVRRTVRQRPSVLGVPSEGGVREESEEGHTQGGKALVNLFEPVNAGAAPASGLAAGRAQVHGEAEALSVPSVSTATSTINTPSSSKSTTTTTTPSTAASSISAPVQTIPARSPISPTPTSPFDDDEGDTDDEDEFFDAIESGTLPGLIVPSVLSPSLASIPSPFTLSTSSVLTLFRGTPLAMAGDPYVAYVKLRGSLDLDEERPSTSLWSVLKHSIGKDLTKISFPVFFNEPTSMLQRMAEDMEFSECLDAAVKERDALRRLAFVAAFAMSNYSSTIGRIAKPFNPMLSETFEYVRFDKEFRYYSEQVSHHPPISACWAEAPAWHYFGEVDAQNKFMGKSFEIRPTGIAHAELILPAEQCGKGYPKAPSKYGANKVVEHYSWKKVTTNVSGFILGSPTIDHYGDMIVTNHRTGDQCVLTFKPRGWRGKDAFEIAGEVVDASGRLTYRIAGRWNSQLIACPAGHSALTLNPDLDLDPESDTPLSLHTTTTTTSTTAVSSTAPFLLWRNSEKRVGSPFNLTPFAITLNDCPKESLLPFVCPTDCRLRPDQRAFEMGHWELANDLKSEQEQKQRAIRKAREEGRMKPHRPRWFAAETDGDTGERVWSPSRVGDGALEYWVERERVFKEGGKGKTKWRDVDDIFIQAPDRIRA